MVHRCHGSVCTSVGGHGSIRFWYNRGKKEFYYVEFLFVYFEQTIVKILNSISCYIH